LHTRSDLDTLAAGCGAKIEHAFTRAWGEHFDGQHRGFGLNIECAHRVFEHLPEAFFTLGHAKGVFAPRHGFAELAQEGL